MEWKITPIPRKRRKKIKINDGDDENLFSETEHAKCGVLTLS